jgi:hypothetical protein
VVPKELLGAQSLLLVVLFTIDLHLQAHLQRKGNLMGHFAQVINGVVQAVITAEQDFVDTLSNPSEWIQTSYNTRGGVHYGPDGNPDGGVALRGNYAIIGGTYNQELDVFIPPKPFESWILDNTTFWWEPPIPHPNDGKPYNWDESTISWKEIIYD